MQGEVIPFCTNYSVHGSNDDSDQTIRCTVDGSDYHISSTDSTSSEAPHNMVDAIAQAEMEAKAAEEAAQAAGIAARVASERAVTAYLAARKASADLCHVLEANGNSLPDAKDRPAMTQLALQMFVDSAAPSPQGIEGLQKQPRLYQTALDSLCTPRGAIHHIEHDGSHPMRRSTSMPSLDKACLQLSHAVKHESFCIRREPLGEPSDGVNEFFDSKSRVKRGTKYGKGASTSPVWLRSAAAVQLQRVARGWATRVSTATLVDAQHHEEWIAYYVYHGKLSEARELGWKDGQEVWGDHEVDACVIS